MNSAAGGEPRTTAQRWETIALLLRMAGADPPRWGDAGTDAPHRRPDGSRDKAPGRHGGRHRGA